MIIMATRSLTEPVTEARLGELAQCIADAVDPDAIVLFGSRARGEAATGSDVDLAVILQDAAPSRREAHYRASLAIREFLFPVDILVYRDAEYRELGRRGHPLASEFAGGRLLYARPGNA